MFGGKGWVAITVSIILMKLVDKLSRWGVVRSAYWLCGPGGEEAGVCVAVYRPSQHHRQTRRTKTDFFTNFLRER